MSKSARRKARVRQRKQLGRASAIAAPPRPAQAGKRPTPTPARRSPARRKPEPTRRANADALNAFLRPLGLTNVLAIARRDLTALFVSPIGWVVAGVFVFLVSAFGFIAPVLISQQATMDGVFGVITNFLMVIVIPLLTMRVLAEERGQGTLELLLTSPVRDWELALGKWIGVFVFYLLLLATTVVYVGILRVYAASLDLGLIGATYVGLVLVGGAALAIGVFASSLTRNQIVAFFVAMGLLLVVWYAGYTIAFFVSPPANLFAAYVGGWNRFQAFSLGQVSVRDVAYFVSLALVAIFLTVRVLASRRMSGRRSLAVGAFTVAVALVVLVAVNVAASKSTVTWDLTRAGNNTLAPQSVLAAKRLTSDLDVIGLWRPGTNSGQTETEALIALYAAQSPHVKYRGANADQDSVDVKRYGITQVNTVVLDHGGRTRLLLQGSQSEQSFTSALLSLESDRVPMVCWAAGDGERSLTDSNQKTGFAAVATLLANNNFAHKEVLLGQLTSIPADCDELAIIDPTTALPAPAVNAVDAYLAAGGRLLIAAEPWPQDPKTTASLTAILQPFGLAFSGALVLETDPSRAAVQDPTNPAVIDYGKSPITNDIQGIVSFFPQSTAITGTPPAGAQAVRIASTTSGAYAIATQRSNLARQPGDSAGPFTLMETLDSAASKTRIVIAGTAAFAQNGTLPPNNNDANLELVLGSFQWLAGQDSLIALPPKPDRYLPLALTQQDQSVIIFITAFLMPGLIVFGGVMVWWRRRVF